MKLLVDMRYACDHFPGIGRMSTALCHAWATHPAITTLIMVSNARQRNTRFVLPASTSQCHHHILDCAPFGIREAWEVARIIAKHRPDWVYTPYPRLPAAPLRSRLLVTIHDAIPFTTPVPWWVQFGMRVAWMDCALRATHITTVSPHAAQQIGAQLWPQRQVHIIPNGIDERFFAAAPPLDNHALGIHQTYDLCVSSNQIHKNLATLVAAWAAAYQHIPPHQPRSLVIAGQFDDTRPQPWREPQYQHLPIVVIPSPADALLHALYQHAALFIYPSLAEGFGLPVAEAMASQLAIICHDHPALRTLVGNDAWVIDMHNQALLQQTIASAWQHDTQRDLYARQLRQRATQLTWSRAADAYLALMHPYTH